MFFIYEKRDNTLSFIYEKRDNTLSFIYEKRDILSDSISLYKGVIAENYVANQLVVNNRDLFYWQNNTSEIDFLIYSNDGIIPVEVKANDNTRSKSLNVYYEKYHPKYMIRVSAKNFGYDDKKKIKSVPLYAVFCIEKDF